MQRRYAALGTIAVLYHAAGALIVIGSLGLGIMSIISTASARSLYDSSLIARTILTAGELIIIGALSGIGLYAFGELIELFRDVELNSRVAAENSATQAENLIKMVSLLEQLVARRQQATANAQRTVKPSASSPPRNQP